MQDSFKRKLIKSNYSGYIFFSKKSGQKKDLIFKDNELISNIDYLIFGEIKNNKIYSREYELKIYLPNMSVSQSVLISSEDFFKKCEVDIKSKSISQWENKYDGCSINQELFLLIDDWSFLNGFPKGNVHKGDKAIGDDFTKTYLDLTIKYSEFNKRFSDFGYKNFNFKINNQQKKEFEFTIIPSESLPRLLSSINGCFNYFYKFSQYIVVPKKFQYSTEKDLLYSEPQSDVKLSAIQKKIISKTLGFKFKEIFDGNNTNFAYKKGFNWNAMSQSKIDSFIESAKNKYPNR